MDGRQNEPKYNKKTLSLLYKDSVYIDKKLFAEQKANVLLYSGEHYAKPGSKFWLHIRDARNIDNTTKVRVIKNHIQKICKSYTNAILNHAPGVWIVPRQERELQHQKAAQLHESCWQYIKQAKNFDKRTSDWAQDFVVMGEAVVKVFWNPNKGRHIGYKQKKTKEGTPVWEKEPNPETGEEGVPAKGDAVFTGELDYERLFSFNFLRDPQSRSIHDSPILGYQKLLPMHEARALVDHDPELMKHLSEGVIGGDYAVFDANDQRYIETKGQVLLVEWFVRPSPDYPEGHYFLATPEGDILKDMDLPFGIFPIVYEGFDELTSTPRHYSIIKVARPYQSHLNFLASKAVEHAVTLGDDKIITPMGTKIQQGSFLPGIRQIQTAGDFKILEGRVGEQFVNQMPPVIAELYQVVNLAEMDEENKASQLDAYTLLYRSMREKRRFSRYGEKFERFLKEICHVSLELFRQYVDEQELIPAIGRNEMVNISEFKGSDPVHYKIEIVPQSEDSETKLGKQLQIQSLLQYAGSNLSKEDLGNLMRSAPYGNKEELFKDWTLQVDNATNDLLALDRGEYPDPRSQDDHSYQLKRLEGRMAQPDWKFIHPYVKQLYAQKKQEHEQVMAQNAQAIQMAESGFIPADGPMTPVDLYVQDPTSPKKTQRARLPLGALLWLAKKLESQGVMQQAYMNMSQGEQADIAKMLPPPQQQAVADQGQGTFGNLQQPYLAQGQPGGPTNSR